jgi:hypothetical protein
MKRAVVIFALVSTVAGVASAEMLRSPSEASVSSRLPASVPVTAKAEAPPAPKQEQPRSAPTLVARQAPVPMLVRSRTPFVPPAGVPADAGQSAAETTLPGLTEAEARAAIEADGYKKVRVVNKAADGTWHARALRGTTEVALRVDAQRNVIGD